jgi:hypothetical protein
MPEKRPHFQLCALLTLVRVSRVWGVFLSYARAAALRRFRRTGEPVPASP